MKKILSKIKNVELRLYNWANKNLFTKILVATAMEILKLFYGSLAVWLTGLFLIGYLSSLPFISYSQCVLLCLWFKIVIYNMRPQEIK